MKTIAFFNNKGGVGKTSLVYHLSWMFRDLGLRTLAIDLDPQANLTSMFLREDRLEKIWQDENRPLSIMKAIRPIMKGLGDIEIPEIERCDDSIGVIAGDLGFSRFEDKLSDAWPRCLEGDESSFRIVSSLYRIIVSGAESMDADMALIDLGPNLGAINRAVLISAQYIAVPLAADLYSLQGLRNLGPTLRRWREEWWERRKKNPEPSLQIPEGKMEPIGYIVLQHAMRGDKPARAFGRWMEKIPDEYRISVLGEPAQNIKDTADDPQCLALLKNYRSLMPLAMEARKPMFFLTPADGAIGAHTAAVKDCYADIKRLAGSIARKCGIPASGKDQIR